MSDIPTINNLVDVDPSILSSLHIIYRFVGKVASDDQSTESIVLIIGLFKSFHLTLTACNEESVFQFHASEISALGLILNDMPSVRWYPACASAVLILDSFAEGYVDL